MGKSGAKRGFGKKTGVPVGGCLTSHSTCSGQSPRGLDKSLQNPVSCGLN